MKIIKVCRCSLRTSFFILLLISLISCSAAQDAAKGKDEKALLDADLPGAVAILPFQNQTDEPDIMIQLRKAFYNHFASKPYRDVELTVVDEKIVQLEKSSGADIAGIKPDEAAAALGCDGIIYGKVLDYKKVYAGVYSQLGVEMEIWMVNTKTGKEVFRLKEAVRYHEGGIPMSPLGAVMTAVSTAMNLRDIQQIRMINELCYKITEKIPAPKRISKEVQPVIKEVLSNVKEGPFGKGKVVRVGLEGEPNMVGTFEIGNFKKGILMKETKPGIYVGEYLVLPGDNTKDMPVIASLKRPGGYETQWTDISGFATIDTTPPPQAMNLNTKKYQDRVEILWDALKNIPDLKGYKVYRSEMPLTGYAELASIEFNKYEDKSAKPGIMYYYRVSAYDTAGNESDLQDPARGALVSKEPVQLSGEINKDTTLTGTYLVSGELKVAKGVTLDIEPETVIMFAPDAALTVSGKISVSAKGSPVQFVSSSEKKWKGMIIDGGAISLNGAQIKGAVSAITAKNAGGVVENTVITGSDTGVSISGNPAVSVKNCTISGNLIGIELIKTDAMITQNNIIQNSTGIKIDEFSGEIKENNILDNEKNIFSERPVKIGANYLGSVNIDAMKLSGAGINIEKTYDGRYPEGKIVDAIYNPYAKLTPEERQKKAAELLAEAGAFFRERNYGKASTIFEEALKASSSAESYYYLAFCYQEMKEDDKALKYLKEGVEKYPKDSRLFRALGLVYYNKANEAEAKKIFEEVLRLNPEDKQIKFMMERMGK